MKSGEGSDRRNKLALVVKSQEYRCVHSSHMTGAVRMVYSHIAVSGDDVQ